MLVKDVMTTNVITVTEDTTVTEVAKLLTEHKISGVPVVNAKNHVIGIVTEGDLIMRDKDVRAPAFTEILGGVIFLENPQRFYNDIKKVTAMKVAEMMTAPVQTIHSDASIKEAAALMIDKRINRVPVVAYDGRLIGIISRQDVVRAII